MKLSPVAAAFAAVPMAAAAPGSANRHPFSGLGRGLHDLAVDAGLLYFGTAEDVQYFNNTKYASIAYDRHEFGQVTPENGQKWMFIEPERNVFNFTLADQIIRPALKHGQINRCHNLVWHSQLADWVTSRNWTKAELTSVMENHIAHEMNHYKGQCYAWDVVNEAFNDDGTIRESVWSTTLGPDFIATAFELASKYDRKAKLYYNDYNIETIGNKSNAVRALVKDLKERGIKIDGVGLQSHFTVGQTPSYEEQTENLRAYTDLGVEVALTELDIRMYLPETPANDTLQALDYAKTVQACVDVEDCVGVTVWGFSDAVSWIPTAGASFEGQGAATLYWANYTKKPAWYAVAKVLQDSS